MINRTDHSFRRAEEGVTLVEGLIVFPLILLVISAFFEFGYAVHQWNQTVKAMQLGVRLAAVSDPLIDNFDDFDNDMSAGVGEPVPGTVVSFSCVGDSGSANYCEDDEIARLVYGSDDICDSNTGDSLPGMCDFNDRIGPENVVITYTRAGLGYEGRPGGAVVTISIQLVDLTFRLAVVGALLGLDSVPLTANPVTITSEDLSSCKSTCT